ncbi:glycoside hydrolase family 68 protein [Blastomonas sp.]|uniref:glycoside hydrolase family 68 protein n=1 Tax=Blastomonas sp. TaxID=1909299 RepID=UPI002620A255|nr:glycoside hydrolase family 68 protein [Blastomonas sp.]MDM7955918.1 glycoside hydrolase family 68 protein [Blastomonas sp.]
MTTAWTAAHIAAIADQPMPAMGLIGEAEAARILPDLLLWDMWPLQMPDGRLAPVNAGSLWMVLAAHDRGDPILRHFEAKIRLLHLDATGWHDLGDMLPQGLGDHEREWSGSAVLEDGIVTLYFTAAGYADTPGGFQQRLVETTGTLEADGRITGWTAVRECFAADGTVYLPADRHDGAPGTVKAFRDPAFFIDPEDGARYLAFTASLAASDSAFNGAVGLARMEQSGRWQLLPPVVHADTLNNELERAQIIAHQGLYYVFWSTQRSVFAPDGPSGPTGFYGMVAQTLSGPWRPLNGTGLVIANPEIEPMQAFSWYVSAELLVCSFVDHWGLGGRDPAQSAFTTAETFAGTPAPMVRIALDGETSRIVESFPMDRLHAR